MWCWRSHSSFSEVCLMCVLRASSAAPGHSSSCFRDLSSLFAVGVTVPPLVSYVVFCVFLSFFHDILSEDCLSEQSAGVSGLRRCSFLSSCLSEVLGLTVVCGSLPFSGKSVLREHSLGGLCRPIFRCHVPHFLVFWETSKLLVCRLSCFFDV